MGIIASQEGLKLVNRARRERGWRKCEKDWYQAAFVREGTLNRFWYRTHPIRDDNFEAICRVVGCDWQDVAETPTNQSSICYIKRPPIEIECHEEIRKPKALIRIKAPLGMGKTSLINDISECATRLNYVVLRLNMLLLAEANIKNSDKVMQWVYNSLHRQFSKCSCRQLKNFWDNAYDESSIKLTDCFEQVLTQVEKPVVLVIDNLDRIFPYQEIAENFLGLLRAWHEDKSENWHKLRIVIAHSTDIYPALQFECSPINIGWRVELPEFNFEQIKEFLRWHEIIWDESDINQLMMLIGGHPELIHASINYSKFKPNISLEGIIEIACASSSPYRNHLQKLENKLQGHPKLLIAMKQLVKAEIPIRIDL